MDDNTRTVGEHLGELIAGGWGYSEECLKYIEVTKNSEEVDWDSLLNKYTYDPHNRRANWPLLFLAASNAMFDVCKAFLSFKV